MTDQSHNAAWRMAEQMKARARNTGGARGAGGLKMLGAWMVFGFLLMVGTLLAFFFVLIGWAMMPFLRHRMKKHAERHGHTWQGEATRPQQRSAQNVLDGEYEVRPRTSDPAH